jgi:hypothetical protein
MQTRSDSMTRTSSRPALANAAFAGAVMMAASGGAACDAPAQASPPPAAPAAASPRAANPNELVVSYLAVWNERDPARRRALIAKTWTETGTYIDAHRHGEGHDALDAMIRTTQDRFPGYQLRLISGIEAHHGYVRFSWAAGGAPSAPLYLGGTDIFTIAADGRLQSVIGFVDAAPAPAAP